MSEFAGRSGLVTGAASGIGRATALALASAVAFVVVADIDEDAGRETVEMMRAGGGDGAFARCDVTRSADLESAVSVAVEATGRLDFAHNNAGLPPSLEAIDELPEATSDRIVGVNLKGVWMSLRAELPVMRRQRAGAIVNTASICGLQVAPLTSPYNATKHGVIGLTKEAALEVATEGVRVNAVCPGYVTTPMSQGTTIPAIWAAMAQTVPMQRVAEPDEIAAAVLWLLSDGASYVTGHSLVADGGLTQSMPGPRDADILHGRA